MIFAIQLDALVAVAQRDGDTRYAILQQLVGEHGTRRFDTITSTHTVRNFVSGLEAKAIVEYGKHVKDLFYAPPLLGDSAEVAAADGTRLWAIDQLYALAHSRSPPRSEDWLMSTVGFFLLHGFYSHCESPRFSNDPKKYAEKVLRSEVQPPSLFSSLPKCLLTLIRVRQITRRPTPELSVRVKELCATRFFSLLRDLSSRPSARGKQFSYNSIRGSLYTN